MEVFSSSTSSDDVEKEDNDDITQDELLEEIEQDIYNLKWGDNFSRGWRILKEQTSTATVIFYQAFAILSTFFVIAFAVGAVLFGCLALKQAITEEIPEIGRAPIIGHFSEWTILGAWSIASWFLVLNNIAFLGRNRNVQDIFQQKIEAYPSHTDVVYMEYLEHLKTSPTAQYMYISTIPCAPPIPLEYYHYNNNNNISTMPNPPPIPVEYNNNNNNNDNNKESSSSPSLSSPSPSPSLIECDTALAPTLREIEKEIGNLSTFDVVKEGWRVIKQENSRGAIIGLIISLTLASIFILANLINYPLSIYWSAEQAVVDHREGHIPSIGGHALEWTAELLGLIGIIWYYFGEMSNVGSASLISLLFWQHRCCLFQEGDGEGEGEEKKKELSPQFKHTTTLRYEAIKKDLIRSIPNGIFFNVHKRFMYNNNNNINEKLKHKLSRNHNQNSSHRHHHEEDK